MYSLYIKFDCILLVTEVIDIKLSPVFLWTWVRCEVLG